MGEFRRYWGKQTPNEVYLAEALSASGHRVIRWQVGGPQPAYQADIWLVSHAKGITRCPRPRVFWTLDYPTYQPDRANVFAEAIDAADFVLHSGGLQVPNGAWLPAACERITVSFCPAPHIPCAFMGSIYNNRRRNIQRLIGEKGGRSLTKPGDWLYGVELAKFVQSVQVVVGDNYVNHKPLYWSSRNYIVPGAGGFLLTPYVPGLEEHFGIGRHLVVYHTFDELKGLVDFYCRAARTREQIRRAGYDHVRRNHTWDVRAKQLIQVLSRTFGLGS